MEKKVYELTINETLERVMPPLQEMELDLLTQSLLTDGCRDPLVVWKGVIVDGHNRYRICRENQIPFSYIEMDFENETEARDWIIRNQLARRNVPDYVRCEMVLPLEGELKALAKRRQGWKKAGGDVLPNLVEGKTKGTTQGALAEMAGVSHGTFDKAKKLIDAADEETKEKLRKGEISIHKAYTKLMDKDNPPKATPQPQMQTPPPPPTRYPEDRGGRTEKKPGDLIPGFGTEQILGSAGEGASYRPPDSVYDIPPVEVYGNMPSDNVELRGNAEFVHAKSDLEAATDFYVRRVGEILRGMSGASVNDENMAVLLDIVTHGFEQIKEMIDHKNNGGNENEEDQ